MLSVRCLFVMLVAGTGLIYAATLPKFEDNGIKQSEEIVHAISPIGCSGPKSTPDVSSPTHDKTTECVVRSPELERSPTGTRQALMPRLTVSPPERYPLKGKDAVTHTEEEIENWMRMLSSGMGHSKKESQA
ncbi:hypothetical protein DL96DRAFT_1617498 [Flagelloscypha sp. PMI_526]|nr:hypothetical protein DL96DRAFT_1617498 [Flagelloscypha sp. PMI_526]